MSVDVKNLVRLLIGASLIISIYFFVRISIDGYWIWNKAPVEFDKTGQVGDFIGGIVGTIFSGAGFYLLYLTLNEQRKAVAKERFENKFFDLVKLHRDNVTELRYTEFDAQTGEILGADGRKVFRLIFKEFQECLREVRNYMDDKTVDLYIKAKYKKTLLNILGTDRKKIDLYQLITIDIAFCIVFYGVGEEGQILLRKRFLHKYNHPFYHKLIHYIAMKPRQQDVTAFERWEKFKALPLIQRNRISDELYKKRRALATVSYSDDALYYMNTGIGIKYYGGHQHRLGHYFRHLFQTFRFLNEHDQLSEQEKYFYGKILRAQLSTYEQALLFVDSVSSLGFKWEFTPKFEVNPDLTNDQKLVLKKQHQLITKYNLIKNLPGDKFLDVVYSHYYPNVKFESDEVESIID